MQTALVQSDIEGVKIIKLEKHEDERGFFMETMKASEFERMGLPTEFVQVNQSFSYFGALRGMHIQTRNPQGKLIRPMFGVVWDAFVDLRPESKTFGKWDGLFLDWQAPVALYLPPGLAHGFFTSSPGAVLSYLCTTPYDKESDNGITWDDPEVGIQWPFKEEFLPIVSNKDNLLPSFSAYKETLR